MDDRFAHPQEAVLVFTTFRIVVFFLFNMETTMVSVAKNVCRALELTVIFFFLPRNENGLPDIKSSCKANNTGLYLTGPS